MDTARKQEIYRHLEVYSSSDNGDSAAEKTAIIQELLMEVERLGNLNAGGWGAGTGIGGC